MVTNKSEAKNLDPEFPLHQLISDPVLTPIQKVAEVKALLASGIGVNARDHKGRTPLHWAIFTVNKELLDVLITAGADINAVDDYGVTPVAEAADAVIVLKLHNKRVEENFWPVYRSVLIVDSGQKVDEKNYDEQIARLVQKYLEIIKYLLEHGADPHLDIKSALEKEGKQYETSYENSSFLTHLQEDEEIKAVYLERQKKLKSTV